MEGILSLSARFIQSSVLLRSLGKIGWNAYGFWPSLRSEMTSSNDTVENVDKTIGMFSWVAARDVAASPSGCARHCIHVGANPIGKETWIC